MKTGLVLEGGAMRGMFTAGVLDVLMDNCLKGMYKYNHDHQKAFYQVKLSLASSIYFFFF